MSIVGGAISGYCATGSVKYAAAPRSTIRIDRTVAKIGRSMQKCEKRIGSPSVLRQRGFRRDLAGLAA